MKLRIFAPLALLAAALFACGGEGPVEEEGGHIEIIAVEGNLDRWAVDFVSRRIDAASEAGAAAAVVQLDSRAALTDDVHQLAARIADPPLPLAVWVGPAPAAAYGGALHLLAAAPLKAAAPGAELGYALPAVAGGPPSPGPAGLPAEYGDRAVTVEGPIYGLVDIAAPSINNLLIEMDGRSVPVRGAPAALHTLRRTGGGAAAAPTLFSEPGLGVRLLRASAGAEAAFFFLVAGLAAAVFEFYALGPGAGAASAAVLLLIGGYGLSALPLRGWALAAVLAGIWLMTADFQRGRTGLLTAAGAASMFLGGLYFTDAAPQITPSWGIVLVISISAAVFYALGMRTVVRARFSTPTIGRDHLVGRRGKALTSFSPDGVAEVDGARWKAAAHREARIEPGDPVSVRRLEGVILEVEPIEEAPEPPAPPPEGVPAPSRRPLEPQEAPLEGQDQETA